MGPSRRSVATALLVSACALSCTGKPTSVLVLVATDLRATRATLTVHAERGVMSSDPAATTEYLDRFTLVRPVVNGSDGLADLGAFTVLPRRANVGEPVDLEVSISDGSVTLRRRARIAFVAGRALQLRLVLRASCASLTAGCAMATEAQCTITRLCEERGQTCGDDGQCVGTVVAPTPIDPMTPRDGGACPDPTLCVAPECKEPAARCEAGRTVCSMTDARAGTTCSAGVCDGSGRCTACGSASELCCGQSCRAGLVCASGRCVPCGGGDQPCCGLACLGGLECTSGACRSCGARGERCCGGAFCNPGAQCQGGACN